jgi:hypothetical protein
LEADIADPHTLTGVSKAAFDLPDELIAAVRAAGGEHINAWVADALRQKLAANDLDRLLAEIAEAVGPLPLGLVAEADAAWRAS